MWKDLGRLIKKFQMTLSIVSPSIDLCEIIASRGNSSLSVVVDICTPLREEMIILSRKLEMITRDREDEDQDKDDEDGFDPHQLVEELKDIIDTLDGLIPPLNLALTTSGANTQTSRESSPSTGIGSMSISRLVQSSHQLMTAQREFLHSEAPTKVGEPVALRLYTLFTSSARSKTHVDWTWKEEYAKCECSLERVVSTSAFEYNLVLKEDLDDGRYHEESTGKVKRINVNSIDRLLYASSGNLLKIEESKAPVLILKVDEQTRRNVKRGSHISSTPDKSAQAVEWMALEICLDREMSSNEDDEDEDSEEEAKKLEENENEEKRKGKPKPLKRTTKSYSESLTSLSILEYLIRLASLEVSEQKSHQDVTDEKLYLYLRNDSSGGEYQPIHSSEQIDRRGPASGRGDSPLQRTPGNRFVDRLRSAK